MGPISIGGVNKNLDPEIFFSRRIEERSDEHEGELLMEVMKGEAANSADIAENVTGRTFSLQIITGFTCGMPAFLLLSSP